jgi:S-adenosylmethionine hydrolase
MQETSLIALFTDFGTQDAYVAQMKGAILQINPHAQLVDLNHEVMPFDIRAAAYLLDASSRYFPVATVFVAVVDPGVGSARRALLVRTIMGQIYVGPDNGLFTDVLAREGLLEAYALTQAAYFRVHQVAPTFHGRDIFAPVAAHVTLGVPLTQFGPRLHDVVRLPQSQPRLAGSCIEGAVRYIDHFGNIITTITADWLQHVSYGQYLTCTLHNTPHRVPFVRTYAEGAPHQLIGLLNSADTFELAISQEHAATSVRAQVGDRLVVTCEQNADGTDLAL